MKLRLVCVGKMSASYLRDAVEDYALRVQRYLPLEVVELKEEKTGGKNQPDLIRQKEGERILQRISSQDWVVVLDERGRLQDSVKLAKLVERHMLDGTQALTAVIGGAYGLSREVRQRADLELSLSPLTFTHQMARVLWLEQLYRSMTIIRNEPYHNA
ncbi:MAG TPA: 23S rRNA (pseudouridine(1915)-N(3))-methyltransferase RlmH [Geothermobacteraceae bacterium]|nr:23S rRNA (pseudouridine(1915)-N(3))-methyltransferase RlmH [Geothermobacteraceae bacterium]